MDLEAGRLTGSSRALKKSKSLNHAVLLDISTVLCMSQVRDSTYSEFSTQPCHDHAFTSSQKSFIPFIRSDLNLSPILEQDLSSHQPVHSHKIKIK